MSGVRDDGGSCGRGGGEMMRRGLRIFASVLAGMSIILCVAVTCWWVRSYWKNEQWGRFGYSVQTRQYRSEIVCTEQGVTQVMLWRFRIDDRMVEQMKKRAAADDFPYRWGRMQMVMTQ